MNKRAIIVLAMAAAAVGCDAQNGRGYPGGSQSEQHRQASRSQGEHGHLLNGFDVSEASIPVDEIFRGGPPRDGIPSIDNPVFIAPEEADFMQPEDTVVSFQRGDEVRAYPFRILVWHEVVNDTVAGHPVSVTYCPLCGTAMVFSREIDGEALTFGVSGLLYHSDVLLYDRQTDSLWPQIGLEAVSGPMKGTKLEWLASRQMTWAAWRDAHPEGKVLSTETGHARDYHRENAYARYGASSETMFPVPEYRDDFEQKEWVIGVLVNGEAVAFPVESLPSDQWVSYVAGEQEIRLRYDSGSESAEVELLPEEEEWPHVFSYWFAWQAFYPETAVWE